MLTPENPRMASATLKAFWLTNCSLFMVCAGVILFSSSARDDEITTSCSFLVLSVCAITRLNGTNSNITAKLRDTFFVQTEFVIAVIFTLPAKLTARGSLCEWKHAGIKNRAFHIQASIPESCELILLWAGLLTCSPPARPSHSALRNSDHLIGRLVMELTAAGQLQNYTVFPFNSCWLISGRKPKAGQMYNKYALMATHCFHR